MTDKDLWAVKVGPLVVGGVSERKPASPSARLICWGITVLLIGFASPVTGVVLIILTALYLAAQTAPTDTHEETHP